MMRRFFNKARPYMSDFIYVKCYGFRCQIVKKLQVMLLFVTSKILNIHKTLRLFKNIDYLFVPVGVVLVLVLY